MKKKKVGLAFFSFLRIDKGSFFFAFVKRVSPSLTVLSFSKVVILFFEIANNIKGRNYRY